jgi:hypothetical protein
LIVPFDSITGFTDPSVPFGFKLEPRVAEPAAGRPPSATGKQESAPAKTAPAKPPSGSAAAKSGQRAEKPAEPAGQAKVVSIDAFRKK